MPHVELPQAEFKVVMLGDTNTGKTSLVLRFAEGYFRELARSPTVGAFFITKRLQVQGITCKVQIWDTAGQKQFRIMGKMYYQNAAAAIVCYDVSSRHSYEVMKYWLEELHRNIPAGSIVICICATKADLTPHTIPIKEAEHLAQAMGAMFVLTSAKSDYNVKHLFKLVAERVLQFQQTAKRNGRSQNVPVTPGASIDQASGKVVKRGSVVESTPTTTTTTTTASTMTSSSPASAMADATLNGADHHYIHGSGGSGGGMQPNNFHTTGGPAMSYNNSSAAMTLSVNKYGVVESGPLPSATDRILSSEDEKKDPDSILETPMATSGNKALSLGGAKLQIRRSGLNNNNSSTKGGDPSPSEVDARPDGVVADMPGVGLTIAAAEATDLSSKPFCEPGFICGSADHPDANCVIL